MPIRSLGLLLAGLSFCAELCSAQDILIFRPVDKADTEVTADSIELVVDVSAFDTIREVTINGQPQSIQPGLAVEVRSTQPLRPGSNAFLVSVKTDSSQASQEFVITQVKELTEAYGPKEKAYPVDLVAVFGVQNNSNAFLSSSHEKSGLKMFALLVPAYEVPLQDSARGRIQGIVSREMYTASDLEAAEIQFTQISGEYIKPFSETERWSAGAGLNKVDSGFDNPVTGQDQSEQDLFVFGRWRQGLSETDANSYEAELLSRNREDPADSDFSEDGVLLTLRGTWERQINQYQSTFKGWFTWDDSKGKYADKYIARGSADAKTGAANLFKIAPGTAWNKLVLGAGANMRIRKYGQSNPIAGKAEQDTLLGLVVNGTYPLRSDWLIVGELGYDNQTSNVSAAKYTNTSLGVSLLYIY